MINSLYVDNFRCFSEFEYHPSSLELLLGDNGSGKSSVFDVLASIRDVVAHGIPTDSKEAFPARSRSAWADEPIQRFRLGMKSHDGQYWYTLAVEHDEKRIKNRITSEKLTFEDQVLFEFDGSEVHLYRDDGSAGPTFPFDWTRSFIATIPERPENQRLTWFRQRLQSIYVFSPDPRAMRSVSQQELDRPDRELTDLVSWLLYFAGEEVDEGTRYKYKVKDPDFKNAAHAFIAKYRESRSGKTTETLPALHEAHGETIRIDS
ncbi:MAG: hypothetical protein CMJ64_27260 [Planctomycetaceae bacterium]|nr:hypothetical protein [Planctomycetaceae bacterium]